MGIRRFLFFRLTYVHFLPTSLQEEPDPTRVDAGLDGHHDSSSSSLAGRCTGGCLRVALQAPVVVEAAAEPPPVDRAGCLPALVACLIPICAQTIENRESVRASLHWQPLKVQSPFLGERSVDALAGWTG